MYVHNSHYSLSQDQDIIIFIGNGVWKPELSKECIESINNLVGQRNNEDFALIVDTSNVKSITPQCFMAWENALELWAVQGLKVTARIDKPEAGFYKIFLAGFDDILRMRSRFYSASTESFALKALHNSGFVGFKNLEKVE
ncbi:hypothetical protein [Psychromonas ossibalaenae]|uniref:hypothetical protein n=1 Tax=Psychromonas ossibalaenae TaxID=444922 RepID=UPI000382DC34|nr:hypothetical protein [Psychromonas ossibalaenae]